MSVETGYFALRDGTGALEVGRDVVKVFGPMRRSTSRARRAKTLPRWRREDRAWALVLQPQGKLDVFVRVSKVAPDEFLLDADAGMGAALVARLNRFKLRTKVEIEPLAWRVVAVRGRARAGGRPHPGRGAAVAARFEWGGLSGYDLMAGRPFHYRTKPLSWTWRRTRRRWWRPVFLVMGASSTTGPSRPKPVWSRRP